MSRRKTLLSVSAALLFLLAVSIGWTLLRVSYPTHSDVFWLGVQTGALAVLLVACLALLGWALARLIRSLG